MVNIKMQIDIIKIFVLIKTGSQRLINVIIVKILKSAVSLIIKYSLLDNIEIIIMVKNIENTTFRSIKIIFIFIL